MPGAGGGIANVGPREQLASLAEEFRFNEKFVNRVQQLERLGYVGWRRIRGDGNCFYRSVGFGLLEQIIAAPAGTDRIRWATSLREQLSALHFEDAGEQAAHARLQEQVDRLCKGEGWDGTSVNASTESTEELRPETVLFHSMRDPESLEDKALVRALRRLTVDYLLKYADDDEANHGISFTVACMAQDQGSVLNFCESVVLPMDIEAEGIVLNALPSAMGIGLRVAYLDRDGSTGKELVFHDYCLEGRGPGDAPAGTRGGRPLIHVQLRPGHYDLLYFHTLPEQDPEPPAPPPPAPAPPAAKTTSAEPEKAAPEGPRSHVLSKQGLLEVEEIE